LCIDIITPSVDILTDTHIKELSYGNGLVSGHHRAGEDGFSVFFPDVPGCVSAGATIQEAARCGRGPFGHIAVGVQHGDHFAAPSDLDDIVRDPECDEFRAFSCGPNCLVRINITLDESLVAAIDKV
jgi:hypothetical protein